MLCHPYTLALLYDVKPRFIWCLHVLMTVGIGASLHCHVVCGASVTPTLGLQVQVPCGRPGIRQYTGPSYFIFLAILELPYFQTFFLHFYTPLGILLGCFAISLEALLTRSSGASLRVGYIRFCYFVCWTRCYAEHRVFSV